MRNGAEERSVWEHLAGDAEIEAVVESMFPKIHVAGGPCVEMAPENEEFVFIPYRRSVNCEKCLVVIAAIDGAEALSQTSTDTADPYARTIVLTHARRSVALRTWPNLATRRRARSAT